MTALKIIVAGLLLFTVCGCAATQIKYTAINKNRITSTDHAVIVEGRFDVAKSFFEQAQLPHNLGRTRIELIRQGVRALTTQLGSNDYVLIGEVVGGGNAYSNIEKLKIDLSSRAAREGGDVVLLINAGVQQRPFVYTTPGYAVTNSYSSAYVQGNTAYGTGTAYTTYTPGQTYAGVMSFPYADGLVFKYVPGIEHRWKMIMSLPDGKLQYVVEKLAPLSQDKSITFNEEKLRVDEILADAGIVVH
jgi:hypothetical protein